MGRLSQITTASLNDYLQKKPLRFDRLEFDRGLGIIEDAFFLTLKTDDNELEIVIGINTNLRCLRRGSVILRYMDLFLRHDGKKMTKREYRSQIDIEKSLLHDELNSINSILEGKYATKICFSSDGDFRISFGRYGSINAIDDLDIRQNKRRLYEIAFVGAAGPSGIIILEKGKQIIAIEAGKCELFPRKDDSGLRFLLSEVEK